MVVTPSEAKQDMLRRLLGEGMVQVMLDARASGVDVPAHLRGDYQLRLNLSYRFNNHMEIDPDGIEATLTFKGEPYTCRIPWRSLYMMVLTSNEDPPHVFPEDMPPELVHLATQVPERMPAQERVDPPQPERPQLKVIKNEDEQETEPVSVPEPEPEEELAPAASDDDQPDPPRGRSHLRVVK